MFDRLLIGFDLILDERVKPLVAFGEGVQGVIPSRLVAKGGGCGVEVLLGGAIGGVSKHESILPIE